MSGPPLRVEPGGLDRPAVLTLDRPGKANALSTGLVEALLDAVPEACRSGAPALLLRANGRNFCAGFDFTGVEEQSAGDLLHRFVQIELLLQALRRAPIPTVALVSGAAFGAGADLAAACTVRVAAASARFRFPGFQFGVALGTRHLARLVGADVARSILLGNRLLPAKEAAAVGLVTHLCDADPPDAGPVLQALATTADPVAVCDILHLTAADTADADLASLVRSVARPDLHDRIARYRAAHR